MLGNPPEEHDLGQELDHLLRADTPCHQDRQAFRRVLIDQHAQPQHPPVMDLGGDKVVAPDAIRLLGQVKHYIQPGAEKTGQVTPPADVLHDQWLIL